MKLREALLIVLKKEHHPRHSQLREAERVLSQWLEHGRLPDEVEEVKDISFDRLRSTNVPRCGDVFHPLMGWTIERWGLALGGEAGEALNKMKKLVRFEEGMQGPTESLERQDYVDAVAEELADIIIYADLAAARLGINLGMAVRDKFNQTSKERGSKYIL